MQASATAPVPFAENMRPRERWMLLMALTVTLFLGALDQTVVSTATPQILAELKGFNLLSWLFTSYMLTSTVVIPLVGKLGDLFGRKWLLIAGVLVFIIASALCGAAWNMESLIAFRFLQGLGGGAIFACVFATLGDAFSPAERGKYVGLFTGTFSLASIIGPTLGGFLTDNGGWRWIFFLNVPIALIALPAIFLNIPSVTNRRQVKIDWLGAFILAVASVAFLLAFVWAGSKYPWGSWQIIGLLVASVAGTILFGLVERRHPEPILPLHLFKNRTFLISNLIVFAFGLGVFGAFQYLGLFVQTALGASATASGIISTPQSAGVLFTSIVGGQVISRRGTYKGQTILGAFLIAVAMLLMELRIDTGIPKWHISAIVVVLGLGFGLVLPTMSLVVQNAVSPQFIGVATSSSQFFRQIGSVMGVAIFGAVLANGYSSRFDETFSEADRQAVGPVIVSELEDPTISLNKGEFASIERQVRAIPGGEEILTRAKDAQAESVAAGTKLIYLGALAASILTLIFTFMLKDIPLRRFKPVGPAPGSQPAAPAPEGGAAPVSAPAPPGGGR
ncbi:MAG: MDR family MFS transporter [Dehalococcoidia bacterium]